MDNGNTQEVCIWIASDHAGFQAKRAIIHKLRMAGIRVEDMGVNSESSSVDYNDYANKVLQQIEIDSVGLKRYGILVCGSGIGMSMVANRSKKVRAALCYDPQAAVLSRQHNDANVLCLGERLTDMEGVLAIVDSFLNTSFSNEDRHIKRIHKLGK